MDLIQIDEKNLGNFPNVENYFSNEFTKHLICEVECLTSIVFHKEFVRRILWHVTARQTTSSDHK